MLVKSNYFKFIKNLWDNQDVKYVLFIQLKSSFSHTIFDYLFPR